MKNQFLFQNEEVNIDQIIYNKYQITTSIIKEIINNEKQIENENKMKKQTLIFEYISFEKEQDQFI